MTSSFFFSPQGKLRHDVGGIDVLIGHLHLQIDADADRLLALGEPHQARVVFGGHPDGGGRGCVLRAERTRVLRGDERVTLAAVGP